MIGATSPRADFYILNTSDEYERSLFICRFCQKALNEDHQVYIALDDPDKLQALDELLWSYSPQSFMPHHRLDIYSDMHSPILLGMSNLRPTHQDIYINLSQSINPIIDDFARVVEIVVQIPEVLAVTRSHFSAYKQKGRQVNHFPVGT